MTLKVAISGAARDAALDIPGVDLPGSFGAAQFVSWFDGHPDVARNWLPRRCLEGRGSRLRSSADRRSAPIRWGACLTNSTA